MNTSTSKKWRKKTMLIWLGVLVLLALIFLAYLRNDFMLELSQFWAFCMAVIR